jgi:hypothetical protein
MVPPAKLYKIVSPALAGLACANKGTVKIARAIFNPITSLAVGMSFSKAGTS